VPREQVERGVDVAEAFPVDQPILPLSGGALDLVQKLAEVLARCFPIPGLVSSADDDVQAGPTLLAKIVAPPSEERVQLFELDTHGQLRSLESSDARARTCSSSRSKSTAPSARTLWASARARHNSSADPFIIGEEDALIDQAFVAACTSRICARFS
jgi:hypothetical protein